MEMYSNVAVFLDGTEAQEPVMDKAIEVAAANGAKLTVCHIIDSTALEAAQVQYIGELVDNLTCSFKESISAKLDEAKANEHIDGVDVEIKFGRIRETIMDDIISPLRPDLVICGARGLSSFKYALLGSVSTFLVRQCPCDLLVVKKKALD